jgi:hypothetical protein
MIIYPKFLAANLIFHSLAIAANVSVASTINYSSLLNEGIVYSDPESSNYYIHFDTLKVDNDGSGATDLYLSFYSTGYDPQLSSTTSGGWYLMANTSTLFLTKYSSGDAIPTSGGTTPADYSWYGFVSNSNLEAGGAWTNTSGAVTGYVSLYHMTSGVVDETAWIQFTWVDSGTLTLIDMATDTACSMLVGQTAVPEPSSVAAFAGLAALGFAGLSRHARRRS